MVNGPDQVFVEKAGFIEQVRGVSIGERSLLVAVKNIARRPGDDISEAKPILDSRLPDGSRVAAVIPPCSLRGVTPAWVETWCCLVRARSHFCSVISGQYCMICSVVAGYLRIICTVTTGHRDVWCHGITGHSYETRI
jgi:hypothetical protein